MKLKHLVLTGSFMLLSEKALAFEVVCRISDATTQKANEAPSVLGTVTQTSPVTKNKTKTITRTTNLVTQMPPERCQQRMACLTVDDSMPQKYVLCDATFSINLEVYTDNVLIHVMEAATRRDLVKATSPMKGFTSLSLKNQTPDVNVQCDLATETNRECK